MQGNCPGAREHDKERPLEMCQSCTRWRSTTGERVFPLIQLRTDGAGLIVTCARRNAVQIEG